MTKVRKHSHQQNSSRHDVIADILKTDLSVGDMIRLNVMSNSMRPFLSRGDQIIAETTLPDGIKQGDIVVIRRNDDYLTHRVIHKNHESWITKGDNNVFPDPQIAPDKYIGRVTTVIKENQSINLDSQKWNFLNLLLAKLSRLESRAFTIHPYLRIPFRFTIKIFQRLFSK